MKLKQLATKKAAGSDYHYEPITIQGIDKDTMLMILNSAIAHDDQMLSSSGASLLMQYVEELENAGDAVDYDEFT